MTANTWPALHFPGVLGSNRAHRPEEGHVWQAVPAPLLCSHRAENEIEVEQAQATWGIFRSCWTEEGGKFMFSMNFSPLLRNIRQYHRHRHSFSNKEIKQDTNPAHSCLRPELSILFQREEGGTDYVGPKVWPRSFLPSSSSSSSGSPFCDGWKHLS